jgi:CubicO group peptidase (beta-lactamase class C family)
MAAARRYMRTGAALVAMALGCFLLRPSLAAAPLPVDAAAIDTLAKDALRAWQVPGLAIGIVRDDQVIYLKGFGLRELGKPEPVTPDTLFPIASCTKAFTTTAMAMLADEGKMAWDDPVRKHVPYFHLSDPIADAAVTLRDLVSHRTGVGGNDLLWYRAPWDRRETIRRLALVKQHAPFRSTYMYQTTMFTVAGCAVEAAAGVPWDQFIQKRIFDPLRMKRANFTTAAARKDSDHASPHGKDALGNVAVVPWYEVAAPEPAGSINACARDLCQWLRLNLAQGRFEGKQLISAKNLHETQTPQTIIRREGLARDMNPETVQLSYGMGWFIQDYHGHLQVSHAGAIDGFRAQITLLPDDHLGIVLLNNLHFTAMNLALSNQIVDLLLGLPGRDWNGYIAAQVAKDQAATAAALREREARRRPDLKPSHELADYAGTYEDPAYGALKVSLEDGGLVWKWNWLAGSLEHYEADTFTLRNHFLGQPLVTFTHGDNGAVTGIKVGGIFDVEFKRVSANSPG